MAGELWDYGEKYFNLTPHPHPGLTVNHYRNSAKSCQMVSRVGPKLGEIAYF